MYASATLMLLPVLWEISQIDLLKAEIEDIFSRCGVESNSILSRRISNWVQQHQKLIKYVFLNVYIVC